jgi:hypothetical protein
MHRTRADHVRLTSQISYAGDAMADDGKNGLSRGGSAWDSSPEWTAARERTRSEVQAAFAPKQQLCPACGRSESTAARNCPHCGASYVVVQPKLSKRAWLMIAGVVALLLAAAGGAWLLASPSINHLKKTAAERDARNFAAFIRSETHRLTIEQRLHRGRGASVGEPPAALVGDLSAAITSDARARVAAGTLKVPIQRTTCSAVRDGPLVPNAVRGGYQCIAQTATIQPGVQVGGVIGYPFWAIVDYRRGSFAWCKINPRGGEQAIRSREPVVNPPAGCDLHI